VNGNTEQRIYTTSVIEQTFLHVPGIGPVIEAKIRQKGFCDWQSVLEKQAELPLGPRTSVRLLETLASSQTALEQDDIQYFIDHFSLKEQWRVLAAYFDRISYFDIETSGLSFDAYVTCVVCYHQGKLYRFVRDQNLDDFLALLEDVRLLASFNGSTFDIPQLLRTWNIPEFPCPHIDLRWQCYHSGLAGGLKHVETQLGIMRPDDLQNIDGEDAVWLWYQWQRQKEPQALQQLLRYCGADVVSLKVVTAALLAARGLPWEVPGQEVWELLDIP
jgi:uncharacterized protein YprB with RNaseH-like and TPR domain